MFVPPSECVVWVLRASSVGHYILDSLASRLGIQFASDRALGGFVARKYLTIGENSVDLTLLKPSSYPS